MTERTKAKRRLGAAWTKLWKHKGRTHDIDEWLLLIRLRAAAMAYGRISERARKARGAK